MATASTATASSGSVTVDQVFSTYLYTGTGSSRNIVNGLDMSGEGGLVWIKNRAIAFNHNLFDTETGAGKFLVSNNTSATSTDAQQLQSFNNNGFTLGDGTEVNHNSAIVSWTFKKAPKFFDVVTYTSTGTAGLAIDHSLGSVPGSIFVKCTSHADNWYIYHRGISGDPEDQALFLDTTAAAADNTSYFNDTAPTATQFTLGDNAGTNAGFGRTYVAYLFAHETGDDSMIQCGSYTGNGSTTGPVVDLGFEPQFLMIKNSTDAGTDWIVFDSMRDLAVGQALDGLRWNTAGGESEFGAGIDLNASGFQVRADYSQLNKNNSNYIFMAIRRPNMATITDATEVFDINQSSTVSINTGFNEDLVFYNWWDGHTSSSDLKYKNVFTDRVRGYLPTNDAGNGTVYAANDLALSSATNESEASSTAYEGVYRSNNSNTYNKAEGLNGTQFAFYAFKRAKSFFDIVAYLGTGSARTVAHSLGAVPEMMWVKDRDSGNSWAVYYGDNTDMLVLSDDAATADDARFWNDTTPTSTVFTVGTENNTNASGNKFIAYLFATLAGVSKVGSVSHSGSSTDVDCGFSAGARFVLLKRIDATGDWYLFDTVNGIVDGNDPYFFINSNTRQVTNTDYIDPLASGFTITGDFTDGTYLFYAIA